MESMSITAEAAFGLQLHSCLSPVRSTNWFTWSTKDGREDSVRVRTLHERYLCDRVALSEIRNLTETYISALQVCTKKKALIEGRQVHAHIIKSSLIPSTFLANCLLNMYVKCGSIVDASQLFDNMAEIDVFTWTMIIGGYVNHGYLNQAFKLFGEMLQQNSMPNEFTYVSILCSCSTAGSLGQGKYVHVHLLKAQIKSNVFVGNALVQMYVKCKCLEMAVQVFDRSSIRDIVSWNTLITGYSEYGDENEVFQLFRKVQHDKMANEVTYTNVLSLCSIKGIIDLGKHVHADLLLAGFNLDIFISNALIAMYLKCGFVMAACQIFDRMVKRDIVSWTAMISGHIEHGDKKKAIALFEQMLQYGSIPNKVTYVSIAGGCPSVEWGKWAHACIVKSGLQSDFYVSNALIGMYSNWGSLWNAHHIFAVQSVQHVGSWNSLISGHLANGYDYEAIGIFSQMRRHCIDPDLCTYVTAITACGNACSLAWGKHIHGTVIKAQFLHDVLVTNALVNMYSRCGNITYAHALLETIPLRDVISWTTIIAGYAENGHGRIAYMLFKEMQHYGVRPDNVAYVDIFSACVSMENIIYGRCFHASLLKGQVEVNHHVGSALIDMYSECGSVGDACKVFEGISTQDTVLWTALISAYGQSSNGNEAVKLFKHMQEQDLYPNNLTYIIVLSACARAGDLASGKHIHSGFIKSGLVDVFVENLVVDMYAKIGAFENASWVFESMAVYNMFSWSVLVSMYMKSGDNDLVIKLFERLEQDGLNLNKLTYIDILCACANIGALGCGKRIHTHVLNGEMDLDVFICSTLVRMYAKCGSIQDARQVFNKIPDPDVVMWTVMITGYAEHGYAEEGIRLFAKMLDQGWNPNKVTLLSVLTACNHAGLLDEGHHFFESMSLVPGTEPTCDHYACIIDLLGRTGWLDEAKDIIAAMPFNPDAVIWLAFLGACNIHGEPELAEYAMAKVI